MGGCVFGRRDNIELQPSAFSRPLKMHLGLVPSFGSSISVRGLAPGTPAKMKPLLNAFSNANPRGTHPEPAPEPSLEPAPEPAPNLPQALPQSAQTLNLFRLMNPRLTLLGEKQGCFDRRRVGSHHISMLEYRTEFDTLHCL